MASFDPFESFDILANYGRPTAGGGYPVSPTGGLLDQVLASMRGGGLLNRYDAVGRSPGETPPNDVATAAVATPQMPLPHVLPQDQGGGAGLGGLANWLGNNSSTLMGLGAGIAGGRSWGEGLGKGLQNAMSGRALDQQRAGQNQTVTALMNRGLSEDMARAAAGNPTMLRAVLWQLYQPQTRALLPEPATPTGMSASGMERLHTAPAGHLGSAKYWGAAPSRASTEMMLGSSLSPTWQSPDWKSDSALASGSASEQWMAPQITPPVSLAASAMASSGMQNMAPSISPPQSSYSGDGVGDRSGREPAEPAQQRQDTLSPQEIENICKLDPAKIAADFANAWIPRIGTRDPMTGRVVTLEWVKQQAQQMQQTTEQIQRELRCAPI